MNLRKTVWVRVKEPCVIRGGYMLLSPSEEPENIKMLPYPSGGEQFLKFIQNCAIIKDGTVESALTLRNRIKKENAAFKAKGLKLKYRVMFKIYRPVSQYAPNCYSSKPLPLP